MMLSRLAAAVLNRTAQADPETSAALAACSGKVLAMQLAQPVRLAFRIGDGAALRPAHPAVHADCEARLARLGDGQPKWEVAGDADLLRAVSRLVEGVGADPAVRHLADLARPLYGEAREICGRLARSARTYLDAEQQFVVTGAQMAEREEQVRRLDRRLRDLSARVDKLSADSARTP